jgi:alkylation response protein AidB-like acyl-CoA dehydrogenase
VELEFSPELQAFRAALRTFIRQNQPPVERRPGSRAPRSEDLPALRSWWSALFREGYLGADWPAEWGGRDDHSPLREYILDEELGLAGAPRPGAGSSAPPRRRESGQYDGGWWPFRA